MSRFDLHLYNRIGLVRDEEGKEHPDVEAAHQLALESIRGSISEECRAGIIDLRGHVEIVDEAGQTAKLVPFSAAVELQPAEEIR